MWLDVACGIVLAYLAVRGWMKGLVRQVLLVAAAVAGIALAPRLGPELLPYARELGVNLPGDWMDVGCVAAAGLGVCLAIALVGRLVVRLYRVLGGTGRKPGPLDRMLGLLLGLGKGVVAAALLLSGLELANSQGWLRETSLARQLDESETFAWTARNRPLGWVMDLEGLGRSLGATGPDGQTASPRELLQSLPERIRWERLKSSVEPPPRSRPKNREDSGIDWQLGPL